ncbi:hypothetical protein MMC19_004429 [Ptychographa xylographoides]|nr:hypothetical protein [Ptychographa xylographoides]
MESFLLPATTYEPPCRQVRLSKLNTIMEIDSNECRRDMMEEETRGRRSLSTTSRTPQDSCSPNPSRTSSISSYYRTRRGSRDFDPLYDVSDSESEQEQGRTYTKGNLRPITTYSNPSQRESWKALRGRNRLPSLVIPSPKDWPSIQNFGKHSAVPPTPPAKIPISPAVLSLLTPHAPRESAPPSLDGSLTSDQLANSTAPPTPDLQALPRIGAWDRVHVATDFTEYHEDLSHATQQHAIEIQSDDGTEWEASLSDIEESGNSSPLIERPESPVLGIGSYAEEEDLGVQLPAGALDTLKHLSRETFSEPTSAVSPNMPQEMQEIAWKPSSPKKSRRTLIEDTPMSEFSAYSFSELSVPSPGGFFSSLGPNARNTWDAFGSAQKFDGPTSSATAEHFYNTPWNADIGNTVERFLEVDDNLTNGPPTAFRRTPLPSPAPYASFDSENAVQEINIRKSAKDFDEEYEKDIWRSEETTFDRTSVWLAEQTSYLAALRETNPTNKKTPNSAPGSRRTSRHIREDSLDSPLKKAVKFLDTDIAKLGGAKTCVPSKSDPLFYQAFQHMSNASSPTDSFIHRQTRYDAVQAKRTSLPKEHADELLGNFHTSDIDRPAPQRPISMMPSKDDTVEETAEQRVIARVERERQALEQVTASMWIVEAAKYLCGGHLLNSPAAAVLAQASTPTPTAAQQIRVLDLGGQPKCDWAWHCAREYPNVKTYTATSDPTAAATYLRGPSNHRLLPVEHLWHLPFPDNHFDAISARSLYAFLRNEKSTGSVADEYDLCLRECMRVLKSGGYLEFFVLDAEILHAGPRGTAVSVEFGFNLKARGYDAAPSKGWLGRLRRAGYEDIKRAWMFLPMGAVTQKDLPVPETPPPHVSVYEENILTAEAVQGPVGSKADAAHISGLVGAWAWERWMLKLQMEMGRDRVLEGVGAVIEEGKALGSGWRCLSGWARKPLV